MTLKEQKQKNYMALRALLGTLEQDVICRLDLTNAHMMKDRLTGHYELQTTLEEYAKTHPELVQETDIGYSLVMISPESKNEEDPVKDILKLNLIEDIFWARDIVSKAFLALFPAREY